MSSYVVGGLLALVIAINGQVVQPSGATSQEISATAQGGAGAVDVEAKLLLPHAAVRVRAIIVVLQWGLGTWLYEDPAWRQLADKLHCGFLRLGVSNHGGPENPLELPVAQQAVRNASLGGAEGVLTILNELARETGRAELRDAKLLFGGHSAAASFGTTFAAMHPTRTVAFVRYRTHLRGLPVDLATIARIPALIMAGEKDTTAGVEDSETLWKSGRNLVAPWTFAIEPGGTHGSFEELRNSNELAIPWVAAVIEQRLSKDGTDLRPVDEAAGWLASTTSGETAPAESFKGPKKEASWLPNEASLRGWRVVTGTSAR